MGKTVGTGSGAALVALCLGAACLGPGVATAQQALSLDGIGFRLPEGMAADLVPAPPDPDGAGGDAVAFRWPDGRILTLMLRRPDEPLAEIPPPAAATRFDAHGVAPIEESWTRAHGGAEGPRGYVVRTGNPAYPRARVLCEGRGERAACRLHSRAGTDSLLSAPLPSTDPAAVATGVAALTAILFDP